MIKPLMRLKERGAWALTTKYPYMRSLLQYSILFLWFAAVIGCSSNAGKDSISSHQPYPQSASCAAICHNDARGTITSDPDPLVTNGSGTAGKHIAHVTYAGLDCEKCHDGYGTQPTHMDGTLDTGSAVVLVIFDPDDPGSWNDPSAGFCTNATCHGVDQLDWYGTSVANYTECTKCHTYPTQTRRPVVGAQGDFGGNSAVVSHHISGSSDPQNSQCTVCHDQTNHTQGTVRVKDADSGTGIDYVTAADLETFCLSCHDANGATFTFNPTGGTAKNPFADGSILGDPPPNLFQAGDKIAGYWNGSANVHKNGGLTCAGDGTPLTGCHGSNGAINVHGSTIPGILSNTMNFQIPLTFDSANPANTFVYDNYKICFDCHESYPAVSKEVVLGFRQGGKYDFWWAPTPYYTSAIQSLFRDRYIPDADPPDPPDLNYPSYWGGVNQPYNDGILLQSYAPLHNYHLLGDNIAWLKWNYRGDSGRVGRITCTSCHNVHGTNGTVKSTYEEFGIVANAPYPPVTPDEYKTFDSPNNFEDNVMMTYPINCAIGCHGIMGPASYWHSPADE